MMQRYILLIVAFLCAPLAQALTYNLDKNSDLVGKVQSYVVKKGDTIPSIARQFDLGVLEVVEANPQIDANKRLSVGQKFLIPTAFILPSAAREGIVLNLAELRLYYFPPNTNTVVTFPVGIGRAGWTTPVGQTQIVLKRPNPVWIPPDNIREEAEEHGRELPDVYPAGPHNPLGLFAMNLGWAGYRMHGTNEPDSIGLRSSHGCIRLYPEDIDSLFHQVDVGTKVTVIHEPLKIGVEDGKLYLEAHQPFPDSYYNPTAETEDQMLQNTVVSSTYTKDEKIDWSIAKKLIKNNYGYPVPITNINK